MSILGYEVKSVNPTENNFSYRLGQYDCYALRKGVCSLYLSEEEAQKVKEKEGHCIGESNVMFCRDLAKSLLNKDYFNTPRFQEEVMSIKMHIRSCGHYTFTDGQHRTCIAKHLNISSIFAEVEKSEWSHEFQCPACYQKEEQEIENRKLVNKIKNMAKKLINKSTNELPSDIIDEDYMEFNKETPKWTSQYISERDGKHD
ncbi:hypothetical protein [Halobacillus amylolyticus]|uniref:ParB/Sulfiredoxin domain-containing protein n=1 Tax=Halobacillus amylolyticus TaxID=2932259 RepID=A0ABY4HJK9_9BACI|nr:hypothetical protein [Halobacillus amylolyticus]UOR14100.1 hypothetical protein MUO15_21330 [Halobacillus amylolyticus]